MVMLNLKDGDTSEYLSDALSGSQTLPKWLGGLLFMLGEKLNIGNARYLKIDFNKF